MRRATPVSYDAHIAQTEVFGPVLCILAYGSEDEALRIANSTRYGLSGAVWGVDPVKTARVARAMETGQVMVNGAPQNMRAPFGGYKSSGIGRENGRYGIEEFTQLKAIQHL